jgi:excinuclease ABC subunit C
MEERLTARIKALPQSPGVYIFKDRQGRILYIGKARSLKKRVNSYFSRPLDAKTQALVLKIADIDYLLASSEAQAQLKEAALIKKHLPAYNTAFRDDKSFPFICISTEAFPRVFICRNPRKLQQKQAARIEAFGPYTNAGLLREALKAMRSVFPFRSCVRLPKKACLYYRLRLCPAPCTGEISAGQYRQNLKNIVMFLEGRDEDLLKGLLSLMQEKAREQNFEEAASIRNQLQVLKSIAPDAGRVDIDKESQELENLLGTGQRILRIEAFDVSNICGAQASASMVSFYKGAPDKNNYRRFRIKTVAGIDDYMMLREVIKRRYQRLKEENLSFPDLIIIDGGKGHLNIARDELRALRVDVPLISIAKEKEEVYTVGRKTPLRLSSDSAALLLIQRIRDEAHRFAVKYHHLLRRKKMIGK